ncbi:MFS transporter [Leifsonia sp. AG29]|uniref:MFS transporter n=1 Tax=Leifsonia sp. AG29 TaxID=2598860 RepID=UPI00131CA8B8|nr:MFS transporter [Leifsonia sp. AG29]
MTSSSALDPQLTAGHPSRWRILPILCLSLLLIGLDNLIILVALPTLAEKLNASGAQQQWFADAYGMTFAGFLIFAGSLGDRFGRRRLLLTGFVLVGAASFLASVSGSAELLIAARAAMGLGAELIMPSKLSIITNVFAAEERQKAIAIWAAAASIGIPLGPIVGGALLQTGWWELIFLINVPIVIIALVATARLVPESRSPNLTKIDIPGAALSVLGMAALVYAVIEAPTFGWSSGQTLGVLAAALVFLALFVMWDRRAAQPLLPAAMLRNRNVSVASLGILLNQFGVFGAIFLLTQYHQFVHGHSPLIAGRSRRSSPSSSALPSSPPSREKRVPSGRLPALS